LNDLPSIFIDSFPLMEIFRILAEGGRG